PWYLFQMDFLRSFLVALPASLCWGASFPLAVAAVADGRGNSSAAVARVYAANTAGAIVGALLTGLVLVAWIGTQQSQRLLMVLSLAAAIALLLPLLRGVATGSGRAWATATAVAAMVVLAVGVTFVHKL